MLALLGDAFRVLGEEGGAATGLRVGAVGIPSSLSEGAGAISSFSLISEHATGDDTSFLNILPHSPSTFLHKLGPDMRRNGKHADGGSGWGGGVV